VAGRREAFRQRRDVLVRGLREIGFGVPVVPQGAFYVYADCSPFGDAPAVAQHLLDEAGVAVTPGLDFGRHRAGDHLRFSYATNIDQIEEAIERMKRALG
jgi:aspartate/methionine/tyrosine aminotransferase